MTLYEEQVEEKTEVPLTEEQKMSIKKALGKKKKTRNWGFGLFSYTFLAILLTLHSPYIFLGMSPYLIVNGNGLEFDMGGIFPHLGLAIMSFIFQTITAVGLYIAVSILKWLFNEINSLRILFLSILGLNAVIYHRIYLSGYVKPEILERMGPFTISWVFLAIFIVLSINTLRKNDSL